MTVNGESEEVPYSLDLEKLGRNEPPKIARDFFLGRSRGYDFLLSCSLFREPLAAVAQSRGQKTAKAVTQ